MRPRVLGLGALGLLLAFAAGTVMLLQVHVRASGVGATCGSPFDVASGRADWQSWYAADLADPRLRPDSLPPVRTDACPAAVNRRTALAGALGAGAAAAVGAAVVVSARARPRAGRAALRRLGAWVTGAGAALVGAGLVALGVLVANPRATLFVYVDRWVVAVAGLLVLVPAIALAAGGRALTIAATARDGDSRDRASSDRASSDDESSDDVDRADHARS